VRIRKILFLILERSNYLERSRTGEFWVFYCYDQAVSHSLPIQILLFARLLYCSNDRVEVSVLVAMLVKTQSWMTMQAADN